MRHALRFTFFLVGALVAAGAPGPALANSARALVGSWRAVKQVERGRTELVPPGKRITWEFAAGGAFASTNDPAAGKLPIRAQGKWRLKGGALSIELDGLVRAFRMRVGKGKLALTEIGKGKVLRRFFLERVVAPPVAPGASRQPRPPRGR